MDEPERFVIGYQRWGVTRANIFKVVKDTEKTLQVLEWSEHPRSWAGSHPRRLMKEHVIAEGPLDELRARLKQAELISNHVNPKIRQLEDELQAARKQMREEINQILKGTQS